MAFVELPSQRPSASRKPGRWPGSGVCAAGGLTGCASAGACSTSWPCCGCCPLAPPDKGSASTAAHESARHADLNPVPCQRKIMGSKHGAQAATPKAISPPQARLSPSRGENEVPGNSERSETQTIFEITVPASSETRAHVTAACGRCDCRERRPC